MTINRDDIIVYMYKEAGMSGRLFNILCKLDDDIEIINSLDIEKAMYKRFAGEVNEFPNDNDLKKISMVMQKIRKEERTLREKAEDFYIDLIKKEVHWTHLLSKDYPKRLKNIPDPPLMLFYRGKLPEEDVPSVAIIGARECSAYGEKVASVFAKELSIEGIQIISGMARGIDGISQRNSIDAGGSTFGILACGVDVVYPKENEDIYKAILKDGGLISEFEPGTMPVRTYFPSRNRIISGLSDIVLVVEARKKSGTYITVTQALEQGREVFAVPGRITDALSDGCNSLLASGAGIALNSNVLLEELKNKHFVLKSNSSSEMIEDNPYKADSLEERILNLLFDDDYSLNAIYQKLCGYSSIEDLSVALVDLESLGKIKKIGGRFMLNRGIF